MVLSPPVTPVIGGPSTWWKSTRAQVCAESVLFHRPALREPKYSVLGRLGSTASRSPIDRPSAFPPMGAEMLLRVQVTPMSVELRIAPLPAVRYCPAAT